VKTKRVQQVLGLLLLLFLVAFTGAARAEIYVEGFVGGVQPLNAGMNFVTQHPGTTLYESHDPGGKYDTAVVGGVKAGTWFVKEGTLGFNYPEWMKYLGFYLELSYHRLNNPNQDPNTTAVKGITNRPSSEFSSEGMATTLAFMFSGRYGFLRDSEVPFGRLQPYLSLGPAIMWTSMEPKLYTRTYDGQICGVKAGGDTVANLAYAVEAGFRWMALKNVSFDIFYNFRYVRPTYSYNYTDPITGMGTRFKTTPGSGGNEIHSGNIGVAYHF
jgi:hypothetical protein